MSKVTGLTTPEEEAKVKEYFAEAITGLKKRQKKYIDSLLGDSPNDTETWRKLIQTRPDVPVHLVTFSGLIEVYTLFDLLSDSIFEMEKNIHTLNENLKIIAKKTDTDLTTLEKNVGELETTILPVLKGMRDLADRDIKADEQRKKTGRDMIA